MSTESFSFHFVSKHNRYELHSVTH